MPRTKQQITVTVPPELVEWLDEMVQKRVYANRSHGVELCIMAEKERQGPR